MSARVLVAFASKHGATAEIAARIAAVLRGCGCETEVCPAREEADPAGYAGVVVGSAVYGGRWLSPAVRFLKTRADELIQRPLWLFSSGPTGRGDPVALLRGWRHPEPLRGLVERLHPRDVAVFHGVLVRERLNLLERIMVRAVKAPYGDFRDWTAIERWSRSVAEALGSPPAAGPVPSG